jgi:electron transport complex protein RnfD
MQTQLAGMHMISEIRAAPLYGSLGGRGWEWINAAFLAGGLALVILRLIPWQIPLAMLACLAAVSLVFHLYDPDVYAAPLFHLFSGGTMLGAFFIATDPVTAAGTPRGRLVYAALIGILAYGIRVFGAYPDGIAFAVLGANAFAPLIDYLSRPRVLGEDRP